jgi:cleavage and polyadenylation specificity factor subunit 3
MPPNLQTVSLKFARRRSAKVMGTLAEKNSEPAEGEEVQGILVTHNFTSKIVKPEDLATYTPLRVGFITSKLHVPYSGSIETLRLFLSEMFAGVTENQFEDDGKNCTKFSLHQDRVGQSSSVLLFCWLSSPVAYLVITLLCCFDR